MDELLQRYMQDVNKYPLLSAEEEEKLARALRDHGDLVAKNTIITANLRFVVKVANQFRAYTKGGKYSLLDLIQEGNTGLVHAVELFDPDKGYKFITYAVWWIRAKIMGFIVRSHSLVRVGTTAAERKLFFKLGAITEIMNLNDVAEKETAREALAQKLETSTQMISKMEDRMFWKDISIETPSGVQENRESLSLKDFLRDEEVEEETAIRKNLLAMARDEIDSALSRLDERDRRIIEMRYLEGEGLTLQAIADQYGLSKERIRQLEARALGKIKLRLLRAEASQGLMS